MPVNRVACLRPIKGALLALFARQPPDVERKQIDMAFLASSKNLAAGAVAVLLITAGLWHIPYPSANPAIAPFLMAWALILLLILIRGIHLTNLFLAQPLSLTETIRHGRRFADNGAFAGVAWGLSSFLLIGSTDVQQTIFLVCSIGLVIMGGAGAQAQYGRLVNLFVCSTTATFACGLLLNATLSRFMIGGFVLYAFVALIFARQQQASVREIIKLNIENERLLRQTRDSMDAIEQARASAEHANRAKTRFLAATSHDLRQPMHALTLYVAHLRKTSSDDDLSDTLDRIDAATGALKDLLDAVMDLSRISLGSVRPAIRPVDLNDVLQRIRKEVQGQAEAKDLRFSLAPYQGIVLTDPVLLERILRNIAINAIRYTDQGQVTIRCRRGPGQVVVRIADTGAGIPAHERERVFEEFYQLDNPERGRHKGLGLGLAIVAQLAALLSHGVSLRSKVGKGTVFRVTIAASMPPHVAEMAAPSDAVRLEDDFVTGSAVLVIDDDPLVLDSMRCTLRDLGCHAMTAEGVLEALELLGGEARVPDLIISDYRLRDGVTGLDAIRILREHLHDDAAPTPIPGMILSGDTAPEQKLSVAQEGLVMLYKPVSPNDLRSAINTLLAAYVHALRTVGERET